LERIETAIESNPDTLNRSETNSTQAQFKIYD
jgi:hypothetical protein